MKVTIDPLNPDALARHRGSFLTVSGRRGPHIQKWPGKRTTPFTTRDREWQTRFGFAASMASLPVSMEYLTAVTHSKGSEQVPRDLLTSSYMGRLYVLIGPNGQQWTEVVGPVLD